MGSRRFWILCFVLWGWSSLAWDWSVTPQKEEGRKFLENALRQTRQSDCVVSVRAPVYPEFSGVSHAIYYQRNTEKGTMRALELYRKEVLWLRFVENEEGVFAYSVPQGYGVRGGYFLRLYTVMALGEPIYEKELKYAEHVRREEEYRGRPCVKVEMRMPESLKKEPMALRGFTNVDLPAPSFIPADGVLTEEQNAARVKAFLRNRPCIRVFLVDKASGVVVSRKEYGEEGASLFQQTLGDCNFSPQWETLPHVFDTPPNLHEEVFSASDFLVLLKRERERSRSARSFLGGAWSTPLRRSWRWLRRHGHRVLLGLGLLLVVGGMYGRRRMLR